MPDKTVLLESRWVFDDEQNITDFRSRHRRWPLRDDQDSNAAPATTTTLATAGPRTAARASNAEQ